jgi:hypothetical protein
LFTRLYGPREREADAEGIDRPTFTANENDMAKKMDEDLADLGESDDEEDFVSPQRSDE